MARPPGDALPRTLSALGSEHRLLLLGQLSRPRALHEILVRDHTGRGGARGLARQTIRRHVDALMACGLVRAVVPDGERAPRYVADPTRLVALADELRALGLSGGASPRSDAATPPS